MINCSDVKDAGREVYDVLGSGHTEATYHRALERELSERGVAFSSEGTIPIFYKESIVGQRRPDLFVPTDDGDIIVELKAKNGSGEAQLLDYVDIVEDDENFDVCAGLLIQFGDELTFTEA